MNNMAIHYIFSLSWEQVSIIQNIGISAVRVVQGSTNIHDVTSGKYRFGKKYASIDH